MIVRAIDSDRLIVKRMRISGQDNPAASPARALERDLQFVQAILVCQFVKGNVRRRESWLLRTQHQHGRSARSRPDLQRG